MIISQRDKNYILQAEKFELIVHRNYFEVMVEGEPYFSLNVRTGVATDKEDIDEEILNYSVNADEQAFAAIWTTRSSLWDKKEYLLDCDGNTFLYRMKVYGTGTIYNIDYFSGATKLEKRGSDYEVAEYFVPVALGGGVDTRHFTTAQNGMIGLGYMTPPLFSFPFRMEGKKTWMGLGLVAKKGQYNFDHFAYKVMPPMLMEQSKFFLTTSLMGHTKVDGSFETPGILGTFGDDEYKTLEAYSQWHYDSGYCERFKAAKPDWWYGPIYCGWGQQCDENPTDPCKMATQIEYTNMSDRLDALKLTPTIIIIDATWQKYFGEALPDMEKFPDLRGFVDDQHEKGRRVVLWFRTWNSEGLDCDECVDLWGQSLGADPTSPKYRKHMEENIYKLFSSDDGCYNCDGFKMDFANCMPLGENIHAYEPGVYGVELLKRMFDLIYTSAKAVKPDAVINTSCCHPYFAKYTDQARLHDYDGRLRNEYTHMSNRQRLFKAALGEDTLIDTDSCPFHTRKDSMRYLRKASALGIPDLYALPVYFNDEDWDEIRNIWNDYIQNINK